MRNGDFLTDNDVDDANNNDNGKNKDDHDKDHHSKDNHDKDDQENHKKDNHDIDIFFCICLVLLLLSKYISRGLVVSRLRDSYWL